MKNLHSRELVTARDRVKNGLKKLLETNELVDKMQVWMLIRTICMIFVSTGENLVAPLTYFNTLVSNKCQTNTNVKSMALF